MNRRMLACALAGAVASGVPAAAIAADVAAPEGPPPIVEAVPPTASALQISATGYLWASSLSGRSATLPPLPAASVSLRFGDILEDLNGGIMGAAEARLDRVSVLTDVMIAQVTSGGGLPGPYFSRVQLKSDTFTIQAMATYRAIQTEKFDFDVAAGVRWWGLGNEVTVYPGSLNIRLRRSSFENWFDPVVGARAFARFGNGWSVTALGNIGGFGVGSDFSWQALGTLNYDIAEKWQLRAGYRYLSVDYRNGKYLYDMDQYGPILGATYKF